MPPRGVRGGEDPSEESWEAGSRAAASATLIRSTTMWRMCAALVHGSSTASVWMVTTEASCGCSSR